MVVKVTKTRSFWHVTINGETIHVATWNGTTVTQIAAIAKAQAIIVARKNADLA